MNHYIRYRQNLFQNSSWLSARIIEDKSDESDDENAIVARTQYVPNTTRLENSEINLVTRQASGIAGSSNQQNLSVIPMIDERIRRSKGFSIGEQCRIRNSLIPNEPEVVKAFDSKIYCGLHSKDGRFFITATQNKMLRVYEVQGDKLKIFKEAQALDVGWSILDVAFSPDGHHVAYSSWADCLYQWPIDGQTGLETLPLTPGQRRFCVFSVAFSNDGKDIFCGASDGCLYIYDREYHRRIFRISGHNEDVNTIALADDSSQVFYSAGDDGICKIWDRRTVNETCPRAVGAMVGHRSGITFIDSRGDGRYLITNSKDQCIKLWDTRAISDTKGQRLARRVVANQDWDYRWQRVPNRMWESNLLEGDTSIMTYKGHSVLKTLIRCRFSPAATTGQRYIYTGDSRGRLIIYDLLTGQIVHNVRGHRGCIRDVSWHPFQHYLMTTSWDGRVIRWVHKQTDDSTNGENKMENENPGEEVQENHPRRSARIAAQRRARGLYVT